MSFPLSEALEIQAGEILTLSGAGGKTSILYTLAAENLLGNGLYTTTTRMFNPEPGENPFSEVFLNWNSPVPPAIIEGSCFVAGQILKSNQPGVRSKVLGLSNKLLESWISMNSWPILVIEADGAAGKAIKYPSENEPVIPGRINHAVGCIGLEALGREVSESLVHRPELFRTNLPLNRNSRIGPETIAALINKKGGLFKNCPEQVRKTVVLNKIDLLNSEYRIHDLIAYFREHCPAVQIIGTCLADRMHKPIT